MNDSEIAKGILARGREVGRQRGLLKFSNIQVATDKIRELEIALNQPPAAPDWNIFRANARIQELEAALARRSATAAPALATIPSPSAGLHGLARAVAATKIRGAKNKSAPAGLHGRARMKNSIQLEGRQS